MSDSAIRLPAGVSPRGSFTATDDLKSVKTKKCATLVFPASLVVLMFADSPFSQRSLVASWATLLLMIVVF